MITLCHTIGATLRPKPLVLLGWGDGKAQPQGVVEVVMRGHEGS